MQICIEYNPTNIYIYIFTHTFRNIKHKEQHTSPGTLNPHW